jgi:transcriptional/translational regulatory protein YebC/TACO1
VEDLDLLDAEILNAGGVFYQWDGQGFCAAHVESVAQADQTEDALIERNKRDWEDELSGDADEITFTPSDPDGEDE